ncbi:glycosyltransferase family 4 protein [Micromonospora sp. WMMD1128]|uniref:glycosyltransferase family 4 protein n=1 Tax=Micromonospora sp. WMMD1128 TaxID=3015150 RepID=UPI00248BFDC4|nr:glycosyltransferase family 4 protein [Micromonospora sp. WMMD1128]WBB71774.1 glycosyltransferase family 4 protein [Micromonospora sp. WMMD1128]
MLVDNGVHGDSRVQKTARSAAEAGWEVILLGILGKASPEETWSIGGAQVRLLTVPRPLAQHPLHLRRSLRRPLAYRPGRYATQRLNALKARRLELRQRQAHLDEVRRAGSRGRYLVGRALLLPARASTKIRTRWARLRSGELKRLRANQQNPDLPLTKLSIRFWQTVMGPRSWRRLDPGLWDYEFAFGPVIDDLKPDLIHANDFRMAGVGVRAAERARARGRATRVVWDAHEYVAGVLGRPDNPRWLPAQIAYTAEHAPRADAVVTVSSTLAELLREVHDLPALPDVVLNAPARVADDARHDTPVPDLRARCGIGPDTPLLVYCGGVNPSRGLDTMVDALTQLPDVHIALVTLHPSGNNAQSEAVRERAVQAGVGDRVHLMPYVPHWQVSEFLAPADAGVIPIHHKPNHELALITKFLEYSHARLPIVVSDVRTMAETVRSTGQGEVFRAEDVPDYVRAVREVLADPKRYRQAYDRPGLLDGWTWEAQAAVLDGVYRRLRPDVAPPVRQPADPVLH